VTFADEASAQRGVVWLPCAGFVVVDMSDEDTVGEDMLTSISPFARRAFIGAGLVGVGLDTAATGMFMTDSADAPCSGPLSGTATAPARLGRSC